MAEMVRLIRQGVYLIEGKTVLEIGSRDQQEKDHGNREIQNSLQANRGDQEELDIDPEAMKVDLARRNTISYQILTGHNKSNQTDKLKIRFDALASHDITYVGIVQTARASGLREFPLPYVLTNCHNSLCAVGGTINEDDHVFGLSAARKYGGIYVPAHQAVIHQYMREMMAQGGSMILGSDSHTRYGALGTMAMGEGGPELVKQLLEKTYDISYPEIIAVYLKGKPQAGVGPQDVALALIRAVFKNGFVKNKVLEFVGPGIANLSVDYRNGIDTMTTETTCLSSIWATDEQVKEYFQLHGRPDGYARLEPGKIAYYDGMVVIDLDKVEPMIALPFHPSNVYPIAELNRNAHEILAAVEAEGQKQLDNPLLSFSLTDRLVDGRLQVDQGIVAGCAGGTFENLLQVASIVDHRSIGNGAFSFSVYPASQPIYLQLVEHGVAAKMMLAGITLKTAFCGPCFGAGDVPANGNLSIRHTTRNFPNREGSKPGDGQIASVALMDARSVAATAINGGRLTAATELDFSVPVVPYEFNPEIYSHRVYQGFESPQPENNLQFGPNIADWPTMIALPENLLLRVASVIHDPVTTTDELIPSGETSSYRSNPLKLAEFTLSRKDPEYVGRAKKVRVIEMERRQVIAEQAVTGQVVTQEGVPGEVVTGERKDPAIPDRLREVCLKVIEKCHAPFPDLVTMLNSTGIGTTIFAVKPGDGSAREQAASSQKVLGGWANIALEYATKRYRSNLINWGMLPFTVESVLGASLNVDDFIFIPDIRTKVSLGEEKISAELMTAAGVKPIELELKNLTDDEREIILKGCLINYYSGK